MAKKLVMKDLLGKSIKDLVAMRNKARKAVYDLKIKNSLRSLNKTHHIRVERRNIAKINTAITEKTAA